MACVWLNAAFWLLCFTHVSCDVTYEITSEDVANYTLPPHFLFGAGNSHYQIEGAWNVSGKGVGVLDYGYNHDKRFHATGNEACDSYHHIDEDVEVIRQLQLDVYRFSLSWTRIFPNGTEPANEDGIRYYKELIRKLRSIGVEPLITLYHFDHPQLFEDQFQGWQDEKMIEYFVEFADFAFETFGQNVTYWTTINEANQYCNLIYYDGRTPPGNGTGSGIKHYYICMRNMILAHGKAYRVYEEKYASSQKGQVGFSCLSVMTRAASSSETDMAAAKRSNDFGLGSCTEPVISGDWPVSVKKTIINQLVEEHNLSSLYFSTDETAMLTNSTDYMGLNIYGGYFVTNGATPGKFIDEDGLGMGFFEGADITVHLQSEAPVWCMEDSLLYMLNNYNNLPIFITENGLYTVTDGLDDTSRSIYASAYLRAMAKTMNTHSVNVLGYTMWSLLDDFEYSFGYSLRYGMVHVDFDSPNKTRTLKSSSKFFIFLQEMKVVPSVTVSAGDSGKNSGAGVFFLQWKNTVLASCILLFLFERIM